MQDRKVALLTIEDLKKNHLDYYKRLDPKCQVCQNILSSSEYETCEVGFPNQREELLMPYAEDTETPTETVYGYVPVTLVEQIIEKHGGWFESKIPFA